MQVVTAKLKHGVKLYMLPLAPKKTNSKMLHY